MDSETYRKAAALEDEFFHEQDRLLIQRLREGRPAAPAPLAEVTGFTDPEASRILGRLDLPPAEASGLAFIPAVLAAWADGPLDAADRLALVEVLEPGWLFDPVDRAVAEAWFRQPPRPGLADAWAQRTRRLVLRLDPAEVRVVARAVTGLAAAAAGFRSPDSAPPPGARAVLLWAGAAFGRT